MTCIEKLRELHPEWSDWEFACAVANTCPPYNDIEMDEPKNCSDGNDADTICRACWEREYEEPIPTGFEYATEDGRRVYVTVEERRVNRFTGDKVYKIFRESSRGWVEDMWVSDAEIRELMCRGAEKKE